MTSGDSQSIPIAIIGIGCRFPGDVTSGEKLWNMLVEKRSAQTEVPADRFNVDAFYHPDADRYGTANTRGGHYLTEDVSLFDAPFFAISPAEAMAMDPMQRLLLEVTYEALENAGTPLVNVSGSKTSCFIGCFTKDYDEMQRRDIELAAKYQSTGASQTMLSNRLSYFFDLKGPSVSLDTACSSGLIAVHLACQSLRTGETSMAIAGGSNLMLSPDIQINMSDMHFLGADSISYAFDERANGYARGEGIGAVILKPLDLALRDNDPIRAVIRGTAASSDGRTPGITMPSKEAQIDLIRSAYLASGCEISQCGYFEAHGTGTAAGDPIEAGTISEVFAEGRPLAANGEIIPLSIGSIKTNLGHLEGASGIAGLIKAVLSVEQGTIAPNIWFERGNPAIEFEHWRLRVPIKIENWPFEGVRRASVNSFGYGGTNAHIIVDDAQHFLQQRNRTHGHNKTDSGFVSPNSDISKESIPGARVFLLSANDTRCLANMGEKYADQLEARSVIEEERLLSDLAYTLCERRSRFPYLAPIVATDKAELTSALRQPPTLSSGRTSSPRISFIFTGQGAQWWGMGRELFRYPVFKNSLLGCDDVVKRLGADWSLFEELLKDKTSSRVDEAAFSQPLCTALQIAIVDLLTSWSIFPQSVIGHSSGEIAAAYATGALDSRSAMTVAYFRGLLSPKVKSMGYEGRMLAVRLSESRANDAILELAGGVGKAVLACVNSPESVTISGDTSAIHELHKGLTSQGVFTKVLQVDTAYHSYHMQVIAGEYLGHLQAAKIVARSSDQSVEMFSSVTENTVNQRQLSSAEYWVSNLVGCVRFSGALEKLCQPGSSDMTNGTDILLEVGPHALFKLPVKDILEASFGTDPPIQYLSTLVRNEPADITALKMVGQLVANTYPVDLHAVNFPVEPKQPLSVLTDLPQYPWNHTRSYWSESRLSRDYRFRRFARTEILGAPVPDWNPLEPRFRNFLRLREQPWLKDHVVQGDVLFPACGYICMAIEAVRQMSVIVPARFLPYNQDSAPEYRLRKVSITRALVVPTADEGVETCFSLRSPSGSDAEVSGQWHDFRIFSYTKDGGWAENCRGLVSVSHQLTKDAHLIQECSNQWEDARVHRALEMDTQSFYKDFDAIGLSYGPMFQGLKNIAINEQVANQATGVIEVTNTRASNPKEFEHERLLHPATLDSFLQLALVALGGAGLSKLEGAMVPTSIEEISISANIAAQIGDSINLVASAERHGARKATGEILAFDPITSKPVARLNGSTFVAINGTTETNELHASAKHCFTAVWEPDIELIDRQSLDRVLQAAPRPDDRPKIIEELELISYYFIEQVLRELKEEQVSTMLPHHQKCYRHLCEVQDAVGAGTHPQQTAEWQQLHSPEVSSKIQSMIDYYRSHDTAYDGKLLMRVGEALPSVFKQEVEPLDLMTHENLLEDYYTTAVGMPNTYAQVSCYVSMLSHKYPDLEYLEIGAGTGGATVPILKGLSGCEGVHTYPRLRSYTYTDISSYFFQRAADKFIDFSRFMNFKKLDVEQDPIMQDFKLASYDVIVAANVLHATSDMHRTMTHARKLLRPGGKLILLEMTNRLLVSSVIFGTLPGWWNASEEWRTGGPLLNEAQWENILLATGFSGLQASSPDVLVPLEEGTRLMIASAVEAKPSISNGLPTPPADRAIKILCADSRIKMNSLEIPLALKARMRSAGLRAQVVPFSMLRKPDIASAICISLVELEEPLLAEPSVSDLETLQTIANASAGLIWVTRGAVASCVERPELAVFQGLARTLRVEYEGFSCTTLDLDQKQKLAANRIADLLLSLYDRQFRSSKDHERVDGDFIEQHGVLHIKRTIEDAKSNNFLAARTDVTILASRMEKFVQGNRSLKLNMSDLGLKGPFVFEDNTIYQQPLQPDEVEVEVQAANLDAGWVQIINDKLPLSNYGQECAGIVTKAGDNIKHLSVGDRVAVWCTQSFATHVRTEAAFVHKIHAAMNFEAASTIARAYTSAYYALSHIGRLSAGESVLIPEATSTVGQAGIQIALEVGARVFATVRSEEEKGVLSKTYKIDETCIFSSQNAKFDVALRRATQGLGVDVVLNTLSGEASKATLGCVAPFGRVVDLTRNNTRGLALASLDRNVSFTSVDIDVLYAQKPHLASQIFQKAIAFAIDNYFQADPPVVVMPWSKLSAAIEQVQEGGGSANIVMAPAADDSILVTEAAPENISFDPNASYLLAGGLGGLGRSIAQWLTTHCGAKHLIFVSRSGAASVNASKFVTSLQNSGIHTAVLKCDISDALALSTMLEDTLETFPPIKGVIQAAMTLNDSLFSTMTHKQWLSTLLPKVHGSKNLHESTLSHPLDFFIILSSLYSFIGNPGQANYAAGCAYQVALAQYRNTLGLPATAIDLGIVDGVGYVVEQQEAGSRVHLQDFKHISESEMLAMIELGIRTPHMGHLITGLDSTLDIAAIQADDRPFFANDPVLSHIHYLRPHLRAASHGTHAPTAAAAPLVPLSLSAHLAIVTSRTQAHEIILAALLKKLARSLMMDEAELDVARSLGAYGTDSLVAVELRNWVLRETGVGLSVFDILQAVSVGGLVEKVVAKVEGVGW